MKFKLTLAILFVFTLGGAAATTSLENSIVDENYDGPGFSNFLVLAVTDTSNRRKDFEDRFVRELSRSGVSAFAGWKILPAYKDDLTREKVEQVVSENGFDAVLLIELVGRETIEVTRAAQTLMMPSNRNAGLHSGIQRSYNTVQLPATTSEQTVVHLRSRLIETEHAGDVWIADTTTVNPEKLGKAITSLVRVLINDLRENKLIARQ